ncbi:MAG: hypothetical protein J6Z11_15710, partial [Candidatus Riflebacteria bacterium]|nr:hypothetical protein [Candidatus Riflebacteria bacterium]
RVESAGPKKMHGPKKKMFHCWTSTMRLHLAKAGLLNKYNNFEAWQQACQAKGKRNTTKADFNEFVKLSQEEKVKFFENLGNK